MCVQIAIVSSALFHHSVEIMCVQIAIESSALFHHSVCDYMCSDRH